MHETTSVGNNVNEAKVMNSMFEDFGTVDR